MSVCIVTGSAGLIGSEAARHFAGLGLHVVGIDNDMRRVFFGEDASTAWNAEALRGALGGRYEHHDIDVRDDDAIRRLFERFGRSTTLVVHAAAQPSHDWAARDPRVDFGVNAVGTVNLLTATRDACPDAVFLFTSTNKVYGDAPNRLPLVERETRYEIEPGHAYEGGIREDMPIDQSLHSVFGASKVAADVMVQEFGRYFGLRTACFRGGTLTGPRHAATRLHGFLGYLMRCTMTGTSYTVLGYKGKQVRDAIHSHDLILAFQAFFERPSPAAVYNIGGGRFSHCSVLEAIALCQEITGRQLPWSYDDRHRVGDHVWWVGDNGKFRDDYPAWSQSYDVPAILREIHEENRDRWRAR